MIIHASLGIIPCFFSCINKGSEGVLERVLIKKDPFFLGGITKIGEAVSLAFDHLMETFLTPPIIGALCFVVMTFLGVSFLLLAEEHRQKLAGILLKISAIAAFILAGASLSSGIIFGIV